MTAVFRQDPGIHSQAEQHEVVDLLSAFIQTGHASEVARSLGRHHPGVTASLLTLMCQSGDPESTDSPPSLLITALQVFEPRLLHDAFSLDAFCAMLTQTMSGGAPLTRMFDGLARTQSPFKSCHSESTIGCTHMEYTTRPLYYARNSRSSYFLLPLLADNLLKFLLVRPIGDMEQVIAHIMVSFQEASRSLDSASGTLCSRVLGSHQAIRSILLSIHLVCHNELAVRLFMEHGVIQSIILFWKPYEPDPLGDSKTMIQITSDVRYWSLLLLGAIARYNDGARVFAGELLRGAMLKNADSEKGGRVVLEVLRWTEQYHYAGLREASGSTAMELSYALASLELFVIEFCLPHIAMNSSAIPVITDNTLWVHIMNILGLVFSPL